MRLAIIGDPARFEMDKCLLEKAKNIYKAVLYVPITELMIETGKGCRLLHKGRDVAEFESVLPIPTMANKDLFAAVIEVLANKKIYMPYTFETMSIMKWRALSLSILRLAGFNVPEIYYMLHPSMLDSILEKMQFPIELLKGNNAVIVEDEKTLLKLLKVGKEPGIYIGEHVKGRRIECLVTNDEFIAAVEKKGKKLCSTVVGDDMKKTAVDAIRELGSVYGSVKFKGDKLTSVSLSPNFCAIEKATGKDISTPILEHMAKNIPPRPSGILAKILGK